MRTLTASELVAQKSSGPKPLVLLTLTNAGDTVELTAADSQVLSIVHSERDDSQTAQALISNRTRAISGVDLNGWKCVPSYGFTTTVGAEYSSTAPLYVVRQNFYSITRPSGDLLCNLTMKGIPDLLADDEASADYFVDDTDTRTFEDWIYAILDPSLPCYSHCKGYLAVFDDYDGIVNTVIPADTFQINKKDTRMAKIKEILGYCNMAMRVVADESIHFFVPVDSGVVYDYEYNDIDSASNHTFYTKTSQSAIVLPGYIVVESPRLTDEDDYFSGYAEDAGWSSLPTNLQQKEFIELRVISDAQATSIAAQILNNRQRLSDSGYGQVPMNIGQEVRDYIKITDKRMANSRTGNISQLVRRFSGGVYEMDIGFGPHTIAPPLGALTPDEIRDKLVELDGLVTKLYALYDVLYSRNTMPALAVENVLRIPSVSGDE